MPAPAELVTYLIAQSEGTANVDIFRHHLPATPDAAVCVRQFGGTTSEWVAGAELAENVMIRVECRALTRDAAESKCYAIRNKLERLANTALSGVRYYRIRVTRPPGPLQVDATATRVTFYFEADVKKARS